MQEQRSRCGPYIIELKLGSGDQAKVKLARDENGNRVAIKIYKDSNQHVNIINLGREINAISQLIHQNIIRIVQYNHAMQYHKKNGDVQQRVCLVLEYARAGALSHFIAQGKFKEEIARFHFKQLIDGLQFMNQHNYSHRDIHPGNLLLDHNFNLKIADFGMAVCLDQNGISQRLKCGNQCYVAPELISESQIQYDGEKIDLFSAAVVLVTLVTGTQPFHQAKAGDPLYTLITKRNWTSFWKCQQQKLRVSSEPESKLSPEFQEMMTHLLELDPKLRWNLQQLISSTWMQGQTATIEDIKLEFNRRWDVIQGKNLETLKDKKKRLQQHQENPKSHQKRQFDLQKPVGIFRSSVDLKRYGLILSQIDSAFKIFNSNRIIKSLTKDEVQDAFYSCIDKDQLFALLIDYTRNNHQNGEDSLDFVMDKVFDNKYKLSTSVNLNDEAVAIQIELIQCEDQVNVNFTKLTGDSLTYAKIVIQIKSFINELQDELEESPTKE